MFKKTLAYLMQLIWKVLVRGENLCKVLVENKKHNYHILDLSQVNVSVDKSGNTCITYSNKKNIHSKK